MASTTRLWLLHDTDPHAEVEYAAIYAAPAPTSATADALTDGRLRAADRDEPRSDLCARVAHALADIAARHPGQQVALYASRDFITSAVALAISLPPTCASSIAIADRSIAIVDWPADAGAQTRPSLIALDVDWLPPLSHGSQRFPGGPGAAPSSRG